MSAAETLARRLPLPLSVDDYIRCVDPEYRPTSLPITGRDVYTDVHTSWDNPDSDMYTLVDIDSNALPTPEVVVFAGRYVEAKANVHAYCGANEYGTLFKDKNDLNGSGETVGTLVDNDGALAWEDGLFSSAKYAAMHFPTAILFANGVPPSAGDLLVEMLEAESAARFPTNQMSGLAPRRAVIEGSTDYPLTIFIHATEPSDVRESIRTHASVFDLTD